MSSHFARSSEFTTTYGSLDDRAFVTLVYTHVLGRPPDASGLACWLGRLRAHTVTRGRVMTQFSESNEFTVASHGRVLAADVWDAMTKQAIPAAELAAYAPHLQSGGTAGSYAVHIVSLPAYVVTAATPPGTVAPH